MRSILLWTSIIELISLSGICRFLRTFSTFTFWFTVSGWLMSLTWTSKSWKIRTNKRSVNKPAAHWNFGNFATYWMFDIFQGSGEGINELVRQLGQETNSVHIQDCHVIRQLACMDCDIQGGKKLVFGLKTTVTSQGFNQSCFSCTDLKKKQTIITTVVYWKEAQNLAHRPPHSPQLVYPNTETTGNSLCLRWARRRCRFLRSFSIAVRIFISRSFSNLCWTSNRVSPARTN